MSNPPVVAISVAHTPLDKGAHYRDLNEFDISRHWSTALKSILRGRGIQAVIIIGNTLGEKIAKVNSGNYDLALEIHLNACGNCGASGAETLYYPGSVAGKHYAEVIQRAIVSRFNCRDRGVAEGWLRRDAPGVQEHPDDVDGDEVMAGFLKFTNCPSVIIEPEFIERLSTESNLFFGLPGALASAIEEAANGL